MSFLHRRMEIVFDPTETRRPRRRKELLNIAVQLALIALHRSRVIPLLRHTLRGDRCLAPHRINRHDQPFNSSTSNNFGIASISLEGSSVLRCPSTNPFAVDHAQRILA